MHNFMSAAEVAAGAGNPTVQARLQACVFKGAVKHDGAWTAVPMCSLNEAQWRAILDRRIAACTEPVGVE